MMGWLKRWMAIEVRDDGDEWVIRVGGGVLYTLFLAVMLALGFPLWG
jgi:hypothetical protein